MGRICKLIMVTENNNNKYYDMIENTDGQTWLAHWGRVGQAGESMIYPMKQWDRKYNEKVKKGYKDVTELVSIKKETDEPAVQIKGSSRMVNELISFLQACANRSIKQNYTVAVADVTQKQVDTAQAVLDNLIQTSHVKFDWQIINRDLLELYSIVPRRMKNTKLFLLKDYNPKRLQEILDNEQQTLDVMSGQVATIQSSKSNLFSRLIIRDATDTEREEISKHTDFRLTNSTKVFRVMNSKNNQSYKQLFNSKPSSKEKLLYHGSRNENWWNILNTNLKIRPANAIHTGSMFGDGIYFADRAQKSIRYTSLKGSYWVNGNEKKAYLAIFSVNVGHIYNILEGTRYSNWMSSMNLRQLHSKGNYDSIFAKGGADLRNNEYIIYESSRCTIKYLIELRG